MAIVACPMIVERACEKACEAARTQCGMTDTTGTNAGTSRSENAKRPRFTRPLKYRYRDSNPGFRHERPAS